MYDEPSACVMNVMYEAIYSNRSESLKTKFMLEFNILTVPNDYFFIINQTQGEIT